MLGSENNISERYIATGHKNVEEYYAETHLMPDPNFSLTLNFRHRVYLYRNRGLFYSRSGYSNQKTKIVASYYNWETVITYYQASAIVSALAILLKNLGISKGDKVGILARNSPLWLLIDWAVGSIGAIFVPLYETNGPDKILYSIENCSMKAVFTHTEMLGMLIGMAEEAKSLCTIIDIDNINGNIFDIIGKNSCEGTININENDDKNFDNKHEKTMEDYIKKMIESTVSYISKIQANGHIIDDHSTMFSGASALMNSPSTVCSSCTISSISPSTQSLSPVQLTTEALKQQSQEKEEEETNPDQFVLLKFPRCSINGSQITELGKEYSDTVVIDQTSQQVSIYTITNLLSSISLKELEEYKDTPVTADDINSIIYTSGSTGNPKGVVHTSRSIISGLYSSTYRVFVQDTPLMATFDNDANKFIEYTKIIKARQEQVKKDLEIVEKSDGAHELFSQAKSCAMEYTYTSLEDVLSHRGENVKWESTKPYLDSTQRHYSYLPLAHVFERGASFEAMAMGCSIFYASDGTKNMSADLQLVKPTQLLGVPRVWEKIYTAIQKVLKKSKAKRIAFATAVCLKRFIMKHSVKVNSTCSFPLIDNLIFKPIRKGFGSEIKQLINGASATSTPVTEFLRVCTGARLFNGYGSTETGASGLVQGPGDIDFILANNPIGALGPATLAKVIDRSDASEFSLARDNIGELCLAGPGVAESYYNTEDKQLISDDGWYHTGDLIQIMSTEATIDISNKSKKSRWNRVMYTSIKNIDKDDPFCDNTCALDDGDDFNMLHWRKLNGTGAEVNKDYVEALKKKRAYKFNADKTTLTCQKDVVKFVRRVGLVSKTSMGEFVDIEVAENVIEASPLVKNCCVHAEADKPFPVAIVSSDLLPLISRLSEVVHDKTKDEIATELTELAKKKADYGMDHNSYIIKDSDTQYAAQINKIMLEECSKVVKIAGLRGFYVPKAVSVMLDDRWADDTSFITSTMKKQHYNIVKYYSKEFSELFDRITNTLEETSKTNTKHDEKKKNTVKAVDKESITKKILKGVIIAVMAGVLFRIIEIKHK